MTDGIPKQNRTSATAHLRLTRSRFFNLPTAHCLLSNNPRQVQKRRLPARQQPMQCRMQIVNTGCSDSAVSAFHVGPIDSELFVDVRMH